jgi:putative RNA 2'-phosphotransferase
MDILKNASQLLASILRHDRPAGLKVDRQGWGLVSELIAFTSNCNPPLTAELIARVVAENDKKRYAFSEDGLKIRALQGHTRPDVQIDYVAKVPPVQLFHGTASRFIPDIRKQGLVPKGRHHVHLSQDEVTAKNVGKRHDRRNDPVILVIDAKAMYAAGYKFYLSDNNVWLTDEVPPRFLK